MICFAVLTTTHTLKYLLAFFVNKSYLSVKGIFYNQRWYKVTNLLKIFHHNL